jgi:acyl-CoA thioesterase I
MRTEQPLNVAALGTSLTARGAWVEALPAALEARIGRPVRVGNFGVSGATSRDGLRLIDRVIAMQPDMVTIEFAINDAALHRRVSLEESTANLAAIIHRLRMGAAHARLYLMTMNPAIGLRGLVRRRLPKYHASYSTLAAAENIGFIDNLPAWHALPANRLSAAIPDGTHPLPEFSLEITLRNVVSALAGDHALRRPQTPD